MRNRGLPFSAAGSVGAARFDTPRPAARDREPLRKVRRSVQGCMRFLQRVAGLTVQGGVRGCPPHPPAWPVERIVGTTPPTRNESTAARLAEDRMAWDTEISPLVQERATPEETY